MLSRSKIAIATAALAAGAFTTFVSQASARPFLSAGTQTGLVKPAAGLYTTVVTLPGGLPTTQLMGSLDVGRDDMSPFVAFSVTDLVGGLFPAPPYGFPGAAPYTLQFTFRPMLDPLELNPTTSDNHFLRNEWTAVEAVRDQLETIRPAFNAVAPAIAPTIVLYVQGAPTSTNQLVAPGTAGVGFDSEFYKFQVTY